ncbi:WXG100 family type VII secretion target [Herpetosiphon sp. NSE202]|uniref:WXG100 family type VII secretion target n=1 Tax=Herpetosiphon sp. NSE202 TaxID=3351349 RepID=UPI00363FF659
MTADIIANRYEVVEQAGVRFQKLYDQQVQMEALVRRTYEQLRGGAWQGAAATAFFAEMTDEVFPAMKRLQQMLIVGSEMATQINQIFRQAEEEAAKQIVFDASAVSGGTASGGAASGGTASGGSTSADAANALPAPVSTDKIFTDDYMDRMIGSQFKGANDPELNSAMETITSGKASEAEIQNALAQIAKSRGLSMEEVTANYNKFNQLRQEASEIARKTGNPMPDNVNFLHPNFLGSTASLRYGKVVGDALGIDPVFASMLNPTGGLVGNGNYAIDAGERPVGYHGIMHDAAGYLKNYHNDGPGYNYLGQENRDPRDPLTGQESGIRYWNRKMAYGFIDGNGINFNPPIVSNVVAEIGGWGIGTYTDIKREVPKIWESTKSTASDTWNSLSKGVSDIFSF